MASRRDPKWNCWNVVVVKCKQVSGYGFFVPLWVYRFARRMNPFVAVQQQTSLQNLRKIRTSVRPRSCWLANIPGHTPLKILVNRVIEDFFCSKRNNYVPLNRVYGLAKWVKRHYWNVLLVTIPARIRSWTSCIFSRGHICRITKSFGTVITNVSAKFQENLTIRSVVIATQTHPILPLQNCWTT